MRSTVNLNPVLNAFILSVACQFTVQPVSVVQAQGVIAVFECRYLGAQSYNWGLNGEFPTYDSYPPDVTVTLSSGDTPETLTIPATAQYNNTVVQCEAVVRDGRVFIPELSVNATLQVQGRFVCCCAHYTRIAVVILYHKPLLTVTHKCTQDLFLLSLI